MPRSTVALTLLEVFTKLAHCATLVYASVRYNNLHSSALYPHSGIDFAMCGSGRMRTDMFKYSLMGHIKGDSR